MAGVRIVTDSACDLTNEEAAELGVSIVPLTIRFGGDEFTDLVDLTVADFYRRMAESADLPETAAPGAGCLRSRVPQAGRRRCHRRRLHQPVGRALGDDRVGPQRGPGGRRHASTSACSTAAR